MAIEKVDELVCNGCKMCVEICPLDVLRFDRGKKKARIAYPLDCQSCVLCEMYCPVDAIFVSPDRARPTPLPY